MEHLDQLVLDLLIKVTDRSLSELALALEVPLRADHGDRAIPCFRWAKEENTSPQELAKKWKEKLSQSLPEPILRVEAMGGYLNFFFKRSWLAKEVLTEIRKTPGHFGFAKHENPPVIVIEYSSPNVAKPFSIGHLRSTNIGASLARIFAARGSRVVQLNHLGDWGTQFGKLITAYRRWGNAGLLGDKPMQNLFKLYVRFHEEEEKDPSLLEEAREWFAKLEQGDPEAKELWQWFRELTIRELSQIYQLLSVEFDHYWGESFYVKRLPALFDLLEQKKLTKSSDDATIIDLEEFELGVCVIKKKDESSLYLTRDLAAAIYRKEQFRFDRMVYVVGAPQRLHFLQLFKIIELMGYPWTPQCEHVMFGHMSFGEESMSTRKGHVVFFEDVLNRATEIAQKVVEEKNPDLEDKEKVARDVALGAILFADLSSKRIKDVKFSWEEILSFEGETGPYLQYTLVRSLSLLRKCDHPIDETVSVELLETEEEVEVVRSLSLFPKTLEKAETEREPFLIAQFLIDLAHRFNRFYNAHRILDADPPLAKARTLLVFGVSDVLRTGLRLLGIPTPERM